MILTYKLKRSLFSIKVLLGILFLLLLLNSVRWKFLKFHRSHRSRWSFDLTIGKDKVPKLHGYLPERPPQVRWHPRAGQIAKKCPKDKSCSPPDCQCYRRLSRNLPSRKIPQIVLLTFDDEITKDNMKKYKDIFGKGLINPNGCPIAATFFVNHFQSGHSRTDYSLVQNLYADGHEIGSHTITHREGGHRFSKAKWMEQIQGQREILSAYGGVRMEDIRGFRAPYLNINEEMYQAIFHLNFTYDSSLAANFNGYYAKWPFTLDYKMGFGCNADYNTCPKKSYPGLWEIPMLYWPYVKKSGNSCAMIDACEMPDTSNRVYEVFYKQFQRFYMNNRAPFGLFIHAEFFKKSHIFDAYLKFVEDLANMDDVWIVTMSQAIQWIRYPTGLDKIKDFKPFSCDYSERPPRCSEPKKCKFKHKGKNVVLRTCQTCPSTFPWLGHNGVVKKELNRMPQNLLT